VHTVNTALA